MLNALKATVEVERILEKTVEAGRNCPNNSETWRFTQNISQEETVYKPQE